MYLSLNIEKKTHNKTKTIGGDLVDRASATETVHSDLLLVRVNPKFIKVVFTTSLLDFQT